MEELKEEEQKEEAAQYRVTESQENCRSRREESHERWRRENNPSPL